jgi:hypothetical protein
MGDLNDVKQNKVYMVDMLFYSSFDITDGYRKLSTITRQ